MRAPQTPPEGSGMWVGFSYEEERSGGPALAPQATWSCREAGGEK